MRKVTSRDIKWYYFTLEASKNSNHHQYRMAALLVKGGSPVRLEWNTDSPARSYVQRKAPFAIGRHAEANIIHGLTAPEVAGSTVYIAGQTVAGSPIKSKPCSICRSILQAYGVDTVIYREIDTKGKHQLVKERL